MQKVKPAPTGGSGVRDEPAQEQVGVTRKQVVARSHGEGWATTASSSQCPWITGAAGTGSRLRSPGRMGGGGSGSSVAGWRP